MQHTLVVGAGRFQDYTFQDYTFGLAECRFDTSASKQFRITVDYGQQATDELLPATGRQPI